MTVLLPFAKDIRLAEEDENPYDDQAIAAYADDVKFGYLTRQEICRFFRALKDYPIKEIYIKCRRDTYYELALEF